MDFPWDWNGFSPNKFRMATPHPPYLIVQTVSFDIFTYSAGNLDQDITPFLAVSYLLTLQNYLTPLLTEQWTNKENYSKYLS